MPNATEIAVKEGKENELRRILRLVEKAERDGKTAKEIVEIIEAQLDKVEGANKEQDNGANLAAPALEKIIN